MLDLLSLLPLDEPAPRYKQVQAVLRELVQSGRLASGAKIAAETQIADVLGVSKMTVNKALLALAAEGVFVREVGRGTFVAVPDKNAIAAQKTVAVSFVEGARNVLDSDYYGAVYRGISDALNASSGTRLFIPPDGVSDYEREQAQNPANARLVVAPRLESVASLNALWQAGLPVVVLGASWPELLMPCVDADNAGGAKTAVSHLVNQGHKHIALLFAEPETANTQDRIRGFEVALRAANLPADPESQVEAEAVWKAGQSARRQIAGLVRGEWGPPVTAIFAAGYYLSLEAMNAVRGAGLRVPDDVSVVGFDDPLSAQLMYPPLTTVRPPLHAMGKRAGELLLDLLRGKNRDEGVREILPTDFMVRGSVAVFAEPSALREGVTFLPPVK